MNNLKHYAEQANLSNTDLGYLFYPNSSNRFIANNQGRKLINIEDGRWLYRFDRPEVLKALKIKKIDVLWNKK